MAQNHPKPNDIRAKNEWNLSIDYISSSHRQNLGTRKPHSSYHQPDPDPEKTFYYTLTTEEELDPEIAADLKKMFINV